MAKYKGKDPNKIPTIINNPEKITDTENLSNKKINIKSIPLKVKPIKSPLSLKKGTNLKSKSTIKIILVICLLLINIFLLVNVISNQDNSNITIELKCNSVSWFAENQIYQIKYQE